MFITAKIINKIKFRESIAINPNNEKVPRTNLKISYRIDVAVFEGSIS